jgi:hypothetical protein
MSEDIQTPQQSSGSSVASATATAATPAEVKYQKYDKNEAKLNAADFSVYKHPSGLAGSGPTSPPLTKSIPQ